MMNTEEGLMTDKLAAVLDELALAIRDAKADVCELLGELRHKVAQRLYDLADRLIATEW